MNGTHECDFINYCRAVHQNSLMAIAPQPVLNKSSICSCAVLWLLFAGCSDHPWLGHGRVAAELVVASCDSPLSALGILWHADEKSKSRFEAVSGPPSAILESSESNLWGCLGQSWNPLGDILGCPLNGPLTKSDGKSSWNVFGSSWAVLKAFGRRIAIWILGIPTR